MGNPLEQRVYDYIAGRKPLRIIFLLIAAIGIVKAAVDIVAPISIALAKPLIQFLPIDPPLAMAERHKCILALPTVRDELIEYVLSSKSLLKDDIEGKRAYMMNFQGQIAKCQQTFGFSSKVGVTKDIDDPATQERALHETWKAIVASEREFEGYLHQKNEMAYAFLELATQLRHLLSNVHRCYTSASACDMRTVEDDDKVGILSILDAERRVRDAYIYKLPVTEFSMSSRQALLDSIFCYRLGLYQLVALEKQTANPFGLLPSCKYAKGPRE